jgi:hypothetical protein
MKALLAAAAATALLALGVGPAAAGNHSGPEAYAKGTGSLTAMSNPTTPIIGCVFSIGGTCFGFGTVGLTTVTTSTSEVFDFDAKAGPQTLTPIDPTDGPYGHMRLTYHQTVTTTTTATALCFPVSGFPCPVPGSSTTEKNADVTADVTCLQVVNNTAAIGGHVTKFEGDFVPTRGLLFNGVDNTVAGQQPAADLFDAAFLTDAPQVCPAPSGGHPISDGDVYVDQS